MEGASTSFPIDHLAAEQKAELIKALKNRGYTIREHFSNSMGFNVISVTGSFEGHAISSAEIAKKLGIRIEPPIEIPKPKAPPVTETIKEAGIAEEKAANTIADAVKSGEKAAEKSSGKTKWIVGGIIAATVAIGAFVMYKRKSAAETERDRKQDTTAAQGIS